MGQNSQRRHRARRAWIRRAEDEDSVRPILRSRSSRQAAKTTEIHPRPKSENCPASVSPVHTVKNTTAGVQSRTATDVQSANRTGDILTRPAVTYNGSL